VPTALTDRTHGRWPWLAAAAAAPATALAWRRREQLAEDDAWIEWLPLVALLWHQTEEWVWPGGFLPWMNREVIGSSDDEFPITRRGGLIINVGLGWGTGLAAAWTRETALSSLQLALLAGNATMHAGVALRSRRRNPGLVTALALFAPLVARGYPALAARSGDRRAIDVGAAAGIVASIGMMSGSKLGARLRSHRG
jgi:hypothetical protein